MKKKSIFNLRFNQKRESTLLRHLLNAFIVIALGFSLHTNAQMSSHRSSPSTEPKLAPEITAFIAHMVQKHTFDEAQLRKWLSEATSQASILEAIAKPHETLPWYRYAPIFITDDRIHQGVNFWQKHAAILK